MKKNTFYFVFLLFLFGCSTQKNIKTVYDNSVSLDTINVSASLSTPYQASETHFFDLLHTKLDVRFDWENQYLNGKAELLLTPWFYPSKTLILDAKGFDLQVVALQNSDGVKELKYDYDGLEIEIQLDKEYSRNDTFKVYIEYTAKPNELTEGGSAAISSDKGLFFIDPLNEDSEKPSQIWTQGETEASSCWFPTIDIPNEKMTQEIAITVKDKFITLSNGELIYQTENGDGTRTDYWSMKKPHAPYLTMLAVGEFAITEDTWRDSIPVNYYVEQKYAPYAQQIFGKTPEMIECFSKILGVDYPWAKYHQIVVREYVSGAMENTSAVVFGGFVQKTAREMIDKNSEDIISHELFHHWFGDLVTCESWANLPLNESFATYGEYIWREYKYGKESADYHLQAMLFDYINESKRSQKELIRYYHDDRNDMFDGHSYSKGGRILHLLRHEVGNDAFFASFKHYLNKHAYNTVEIHDLRIAFEEITGRDLNWFFNQWFLSSGHPDLRITYEYIDSTSVQKIIVEQQQTRKETPIYRLPVLVDLYVDGKIIHKKIVIKDKYNEFLFPVTSKPNLINVDAQKILLCTKTDIKTNQEWIYQYQNAPLYLDRYEAVNALGKNANTDSLAASLVLEALNDSFWKIRALAIHNLDPLINNYKNEIKSKLIAIAKNDTKSSVRTSAIALLASEFKNDSLKSLFIEGIKDSSYAVMKESLVSLTTLDNAQGLAYCKQLEKEQHKSIMEAICYIYSSYGDDSNHPFFVSSAKKINGYTLISFINDYSYYLSGNRALKIVFEGVDILKDLGINNSNHYVSMFAKQALTDLENEYKKRQYDWEKKQIKSTTSDNITELETQKKEQEQLLLLIKHISSASKEVESSLK